MQVRIARPFTVGPADAPTPIAASDTPVEVTRDGPSISLHLPSRIVLMSGDDFLRRCEAGDIVQHWPEAAV